MPKTSEVKRGVKVVPRTPQHTPTEDSNGACNPDLGGFEKVDYHYTCRSVTVYWSSPAKEPSNTLEPDVSDLADHQRPVPRPRTKLHKNSIKEEHQIVFRQEKNCDTFQICSEEVPRNKCLEELLEVFKCSECEEGRYLIDQSYKLLDKDNEIMSSNQNHQNIRARIQAFEGQTGTEGENGSPPATADLPPRRATYKPPVASKPAVALTPPRTNDLSQNMFASQNSQNQELLTRPEPPTKPLEHSVIQELEALHSKRGPSHRSRPFGLTRSNSIHEAEPRSFLPAPPVKPFKEPLKPNLNINNHNLQTASESVTGPLSE